MALNLQDYCYCRFPAEYKGENNVNYDHIGLNVFFVTGDRCTVHLKDKSLIAGRGEIVYATEEVQLEIPKDGHVWGINIDGIIAHKFCKDTNGAFVVGSIFAPFLPQQVVQIASNYSLMSETYLCNTAFEIINTLNNCEKKSILASKLVSQAINLIRENYGHVYGVEELAASLNVSKSHLVREFYKYTGTTPGKYLSNIRIDAVKNLLVQSNLSLNEIAVRTGFSGDNYLCKAFKKATGETPMAYKTKIITSQYLPNQLSLKIDPEVYV